MNLLRRIVKNKNTKAGIWYIGGNFFDKAIVFLTIPIFTRILNTYDYGIVNTYLSWVGISAIITGMSLGGTIRNAYVDYRKDLDGYMSSIMYLSILSFTPLSLLTIIITMCFLHNDNITLVILCLIQGHMTFISTSVGQRYMMEFQYKKNTLLMAIPHIFIVGLSVVSILMLNENKYLGRILPYVLVTMIVGIAYLYVIFKRSNSLNTKYWKYAITLSLPLILHGLSMNILSQTDRIIITTFNGAAETGVYSLIYNLSMIPMVFSASLDSVWIPWFTQQMQNNNKPKINKTVSYYIELMLVIIVVLLFVSPEIIKILAPKEYWSGINLIPPIIVSSFVMYLYTIEVHIEYYYKATKSIAINTCCAAIINLVLNLIFIPKFGSLAAAFTTLIAYTISFLMHYLMARKLDKELINFKKYIIPILIVILTSIIVYVFLDNVLIRWGSMCIGFTLYTVYAIKAKRFNELLND